MKRHVGAVLFITILMLAGCAGTCGNLYTNESIHFAGFNDTMLLIDIGQNPDTWSRSRVYAIIPLDFVYGQVSSTACNLLPIWLQTHLLTQHHKKAAQLKGC